MGHANKSIVAVQGTDSLRVDVSDVLKYPESFLALCMSSQFVEKKKSGAIIVRDRDVKCFPLVEKYYKSGKVKLLDAAMNLEDVRKELSLWFPGSAIDIVYKDPLVHFDYIQRQQTATFFETEGERLEGEVLARAKEGHIQFTRTLDNEIIRGSATAIAQHQKLYYELVVNLFPDSGCSVSVQQQNFIDPNGWNKCKFPLTISWQLGVGSLGKLSEVNLKTKSKAVLQQLLAQGAKEFVQGKSSVKLHQLYHQLFSGHDIPDNFEDFFEKYAHSKSTSGKFTLTWQWGTVTWDFSAR